MINVPALQNNYLLAHGKASTWQNEVTNGCRKTRPEQVDLKGREKGGW